MSERCPTCQQKLPPDRCLTRICFLCQKPLGRHDKWQYIKLEVGGKIAIAIRHKHCDNPKSYTPLKEATCKK